MDSFVAKIYGLRNMAEEPYSRSISYFFSKFGPNLFTVVQAATFLSSLAKNVGAVHQSFHMCLMGGSVAKIYDLTNITVCNEKTVFCKARKTVYCKMRKTVNCKLRKTVIRETNMTVFYKMSKTVFCRTSRTVIWRTRKSLICEKTKL